MSEASTNYEQRDEVPTRWVNHHAPWRMNMGVNPADVPAGISVVASGADGRWQGALGRALGAVLLEDVRRRPLKQFGQTVPQEITIPPQAVWAEVLSGRDVCLDVWPFEIGSHGQSYRAIRGFVVRSAVPTLLKSSAANVPLVFLLVYHNEALGFNHAAERIDQPLTTKSRFGIVLLRLPERVVLDTTVTLGGEGDPPESPLRHYNDFARDNDNNQTRVARLLQTASPIRVSHDERFIYIYSTVGDFSPVTVWFQQQTTPERFGSARHPGWHWEPMGPGIETDDMNSRSSMNGDVTLGGNLWHVQNGWSWPNVTPTGASGEGYALGTPTDPRYYQFAAELWDTFRRRYVGIGPRFSYLLGDDLLLSGQRYITAGMRRFNIGATTTAGGIYTNLDARDVEFAVGYRRYRQFATQNTYATSDSGTATPKNLTLGPGGTLRECDVMSTPQGTTAAEGLAWLLDQNAAAEMSGLLTAAQVFRRVRVDADKAIDKILVTDEYLGIRQQHELAEAEVENPPTRVLAALNFQDVNIIATDAVEQSKTDTDPAKQDTAHVALTWSSLTRGGAPECFPRENVFRTKIDVNAEMVMVAAGDYAFIIGDNWAVRQHLSVDGLGNPVMVTYAMPIGLVPVSNKAAVAAGGQIFVLCQTGAFLVEPGTFSVTRLDSLDWLTWKCWAGSLSSVSCGYDVALDAVIVLNSATESAVVMWMGTGQTTLLEHMRFTQVVHATVKGQRRCVLVTPEGRFVYLRMSDAEDADGSRTTLAVTQTAAMPITSSFNRKVLSVTSGLQEWTIVLDGPLDLFQSEYTGEDPQSYRHYWFGTYLGVIDGSARGASLPIYEVPVQGATPVIRVSKLLYNGPIPEPGDHVGMSPVPLAMVYSPLGSSKEDTVSGTRRRTATSANVVALSVDGSVPTEADTFPVLDVGVVDYAGFKAAWPQRTRPTGDLIAAGPWPGPTGWVVFPSDGERRVSLPPAGLYSADDPARMFGPLVASGHLLWPYVRMMSSNMGIELREVVLQGTMSAVESTLPVS